MDLLRVRQEGVGVTSLFSRLQKLNKEATPPNWWIPSHGHDAQRIVAGGKPGANLVGSVDVVPSEFARVEENDAELIVECRNSLPAVLNLIEAAQHWKEICDTSEERGVSQDTATFIAWQDFCEALARLVSGDEV
jgi:hypothetical protein